MSKVLFSVVIPTYNCADLLSVAMKSVINQTYSGFEMIVVDNQSKDHTREIVSRFNDPRIRYLQINNQGIIAASRNLGIREARGPWVSFLDADDTWYPGKLESVKKEIESTPDAILICHDQLRVVNGKPKNILRFGPNSEHMYDRLLFHDNALSTSAVTVRKDMLVSIGGFSERKDFISIEDYDCWMKLAQKGSFHFIKSVLGDSHVHGGNESLNVERHANALITVVSHHLESLSPGPDAKRKNRRLSSVWATGGRLFLKSGYFLSARKLCMKSVQYSFWNPKAWAVFALSLLRIRI